MKNKLFRSLHILPQDNCPKLASGFHRSIYRGKEVLFLRIIYYDENEFLLEISYFIAPAGRLPAFIQSYRRCRTSWLRQRRNKSQYFVEKSFQFASFSSWYSRLNPEYKTLGFAQSPRGTF